MLSKRCRRKPRGSMRIGARTQPGSEAAQAQRAEEGRAHRCMRQHRTLCIMLCNSFCAALAAPLLAFVCLARFVISRRIFCTTSAMDAPGLQANACQQDRGSTASLLPTHQGHQRLHAAAAGGVNRLPGLLRLCSAAHQNVAVKAHQGAARLQLLQRWWPCSCQGWVQGNSYSSTRHA